MEKAGDIEKLKAARQESVPNHLYYGLPVIAAVTIGLLISSDCAVGASTEVDGHAPFGALVPHTASSDNLWSGVKRLADSNAWLMVIIVAIMSGVWPYVKVLVSLAVVVLGRKGKMSIDTCRTCLHFLEMFGKYSWADVIMIVFNMMIFTIHTRNWTILNVEHLQVNLWMELHYGAIALVIALVCSTLLTHWAAFEISRHIPRWDVITSARNKDGGSEEGRPLLSERGSSRTRQLTPRLEALLGARRWLFLSSAVAGLILLVVGSTVTMVHIRRTGFFSNLIREEDRHMDLSIFSIAHGLTRVARWTGSPSITGMQAVFCILAFCAPCMEIVALAAGIASTWSNISRSYLAFQVAEWAHSFGGIEVLLFTCIACLFELENVVKFNMGSECDPFKDLMNNKVALTIAGLGDAVSDECFMPVASLGPAWYIMFGYIFFRTVAWRWVYRWLDATGEIVRSKDA